MSESVNIQRRELKIKIPTIAHQQIPVKEDTPVYILFYQRREAARRYLNSKYSEVAQEELLCFIEYCNEQIKKYLGL